jgi:pimeloyl-ACP methyl ester carboxylesterase
MARLMAGSELVLVEGMGHVIPSSRYELVADAITRNAKRA